MYSEDMYRNPFSDYNANTLDSQQLIDFWESPFGNYLLDIGEEEVVGEKTAIVFTGGRGTGKTMLLKHFSLSAQRVRAKMENKNLKDYLLKQGCIGLYIRFDSPLLIGFDGLGISKQQWDVIFTHFFEMTVCKAYVEAFRILSDENAITIEEENCLRAGLVEILGYSGRDIKDLKEVAKALSEDINYVNKYRAEVIFSNVSFAPTRIYTFGSLQFTIAELFKNECADLQNINNLILIDEYENFLPFEQCIINSAIKFSKNIAFRVGMRQEGFHTFATVSENEFIKEHRDYKNVVFDNPLIGKSNGKYFDFLDKIAEKRLCQVSVFKDNKLTNIKKILGDKEDYKKEALEIVKGRDKHINEYLREVEKICKKKNIQFNKNDKRLEKLRYPENPLYEMQNMRMLLKPYPIEYVVKAFEDYLKNIQSVEATKYKNDYENKYRFSYLFVLCSIYKVESKQYYGFNDFAYLSSGIVGTFLELCRCSFQYAFFENKEDLLKGFIEASIQTKAAFEVANSEFEQIRRISKVGNEVYALAKNIGTKFSSYHTDKRIKYPETNQFSFDSSLILKNSCEDRIFSSAIMWSVFQKKKGLQQASIGEKAEEIYILNRIYAPIFQISLRTRGGYNYKLSIDRLNKLCSIEYKEENTVDEEFWSDTVSNGQITFFEYLGDEYESEN